MTLEDYIREQRERYVGFAGTVSNIITAGLNQRPDITPPLFATDRAKDPSSLRRKLEERNLLSCAVIEEEIKDLAGCRLVFNTNTDVNQFLQSRVIFDNFVVDFDETKIHHPVPGTDAERRDYRAIHYIVSLTPERLALPEYGRYAGLRCEIQIHTLLDHAWSETSHDIIYKNPIPPGFGTKQLDQIKRRMHNIMTKYLVPAGFEFQKVQHDFKRIAKGKDVLQRRPFDELAASTDNNQRHDFLEEISQHVVPHYDDIRTLHPELLRVAANSIEDARQTPTKAIETPYGNFDGKTVDAVTELAVNMIDDIALRYVDPAATFRTYCQIFPGALSEGERNHILNAVEHLAEHNLHVWQQVGPAVQSELLEVIRNFNADERQRLRPLIILACTQVLSSDVSGSAMTSFDTVTFSRGAVRASEPLSNIRRAALDALEHLYLHSASDAEREAAFRGMMEATRFPSAGTSDNLLHLILEDSTRIVKFCSAQHASMSFELRQVVEHDFHWLYRHAPSRATIPAVKAAADKLIEEISTFRDLINVDADFVVHKTLVGFQSVFPPDWESDDVASLSSNLYREAQVDEYITQVTEQTSDYWLRMIERCAGTESNDGATFIVFSKFLERLSAAQPDLILKYLESASPRVTRFLNPILTGLAKSSASASVSKTIRAWIDRGQHLRDISHHLRFASGSDRTLVIALSDKALETADVIAVLLCIAAVVARTDLHDAQTVDCVLLPCLQFLTERQDARWVDEAWFQPTGRQFFSSLSPAQAAVVFANLVYRRAVDYRIEQILASLSKVDCDAVWNFFRDRLRRKSQPPKADRFDAIPFKFNEVHRALGEQPERAIDIVRGWHREDDYLFEFGGGRLLAIAFPNLSDRFRDKLVSLVASEGAPAFSFVRSILNNYRGDPRIHPICQALVECLPENDERLGQVETLLMATGVVSGPYGFVEAHKEKKDQLAPWFDDPRPKVKAFATAYARSLDQRMASEQRDAEQRHELRKLDWQGDEEATKTTE